ncbi:MAG: hypothetical protein KW802_03005 [Candidatus Doudnabacteria bacterium]|nr:hypothetical protein [Candidatus Doudnabacteria bacterium]
MTDKTGLVEFVTDLKEIFGNDLMVLSTGGTAKLLREQKLPVTEVASFTGSPEGMGGRVKTLHPKIFGGILARRNDPSDMADLFDKYHSAPIDLVAVNLYSFAKTAANPDTPFDELVEQIDIGGPSMIRAAAKNYRDVLVVVDPSDYPRVLSQLRREAGPDLFIRHELMRKVFLHTAEYDSCIAREMNHSGLQGDQIIRFMHL